MGPFSSKLLCSGYFITATEMKQDPSHQVLKARGFWGGNSLSTGLPPLSPCAESSAGAKWGNALWLGRQSRKETMLRFEDAERIELQEDRGWMFV